MADSTAIKLQAHRGRGLYESFYFRGTSADGGQAFWLKHNLLRLHHHDEVWLEGALILFDRASNKTSAVYAREVLDGERFQRIMEQGRDWEHVALDVSRTAFVEINRNYLGGRLSGEGGYAHWDLQVHHRGPELAPFPYKAMYCLPWPRNKMLTRDCHVDFKGSMTAGGLAFDGVFHGMNGHIWGSEHAHAYANANCASFASHQDAYFDGFSARLALGGGRFVTPYLSMASLYVRGRWHHFNSLMRVARQKVLRFEDRAWQAQLFNSSHRLEVEVDGASPAQLPWVALNYADPQRKRAVVNNTKFATLRLRLVHRNGELQEELASEVCELETLLPGTAPKGRGYVGRP